MAGRPVLTASSAASVNASVCKLSRYDDRITVGFRVGTACTNARGEKSARRTGEAMRADFFERRTADIDRSALGGAFKTFREEIEAQIDAIAGDDLDVPERTLERPRRFEASHGFACNSDARMTLSTPRLGGPGIISAPTPAASMISPPGGEADRRDKERIRK